MSAVAQQQLQEPAVGFQFRLPIRLRVQLHGCPNVLMTEQALHRFRIHFQLHQRRRQRMPEVMKAKTYPLVRPDNASLDSSGPYLFPKVQPNPELVP